jgi:hypothetical protein
MSSSAILPHEILTEVPGYRDLSLLYAVGYIQAFRGVCESDGREIYLKLCPTAHLETIARLRHNWTLQAEIAIGGATVPHKLVPFGDNGLLIEYGRYGEKTSREKWLCPGPYVSSGCGIDAMPFADSETPEPMFRSRRDILAILKAFVTVILDVALLNGRYAICSFDCAT